MKLHSSKHSFSPFLSVILATAALSILAGCYSAPRPVAYGPPRQAVQVVEVDDYVYYPDYEVYYNNRRHQYVYRDNNVWVTRPQPPRIWARNLRAAPSVRVDFHDAPEHHHADIVRTYPKNWRPQPAPPRPSAPPDRNDRNNSSDRR